MPGLRTLLAASLGVFAVLGVAPEAVAQENQYWDGGYGEKAEYRSDVVLGAATGVLLGNAFAYPNEVEKIDDPAYEVNTNFGVGSHFAFWLGGALKDWFVFGIGGFGNNLTGSDVKASGGGAFFHIETYPFFPMGGRLRDLAIYADFGAGGLGQHDVFPHEIAVPVGIAPEFDGMTVAVQNQEWEDHLPRRHSPVREPP